MSPCRLPSLPPSRPPVLPWAAHYPMGGAQNHHTDPRADLAYLFSPLAHLIFSPSYSSLFFFHFLLTRGVGDRTTRETSTRRNGGERGVEDPNAAP